MVVHVMMYMYMYRYLQVKLSAYFSGSGAHKHQWHAFHVVHTVKLKINTNTLSTCMFYCVEKVCLCSVHAFLNKQHHTKFVCSVQ